MRIAIYHNLLSGGAKRALYEETRRLSANHQLDVFTLSSANHEFADLRPYVARHQVYDFQPGALLNSPFGRLNQAIRQADLQRLRSLARRIAQDIEAGNFDLCFVQPCQYESSPSILSYLQHLPTVYYCHEPLRRMYEEMPLRPYENSDSTLRKTLDRFDPLIASYQHALKNNDRKNLRSANLILVNSEFIRNSVRSIYQAEAQVSYLGVDVDWFRPLTEPKQDFVLSVGSLTPLKGFDFLINALALIPEVQRPILVIASNFQNPPEKTYLEQLAQSQKVDLKLEGNVSEERLVQLYNQAKIAVYAAIREPFGLVPVEAMACGTAVVAIRDGGVQETILDGETGLLVARDPEKFAAALQKLLSNPELAQEYGHNGRTHILNHWTWDKANQTLENYLTSV